MRITDDIIYAGVNDHQVDLFEANTLCRTEWHTILI